MGFVGRTIVRSLKSQVQISIISLHPMPYNSLFSPLKIGYNMTKNRIFMAALTRDRAKDSIPSELMKEYYVQRVSAGMIVTEAIMISPQGYVSIMIVTIPCI